MNLPANYLSILNQVVPFILIAIVFYFFIIRPQNKQKVELENMINNLKVGDKIVTRGGILGKIYQVLDQSFVVEVYDGAKIEFLKNAIINVINDQE